MIEITLHHIMRQNKICLPPLFIKTSQTKEEITGQLKTKTILYKDLQFQTLLRCIKTYYLSVEYTITDYAERVLRDKVHD